MGDINPFHFEEDWDWSQIFEEIWRLGLMGFNEISELTSELKEKEDAVHEEGRTEEDVLDCLNLQIHLLDTISSRRENFKIYQRWDDIDQKIMYRAHSLFCTYETLCCKSLLYWEERLKFNLKLKWFDGVSNVYHSAVIHLGSDHPHLFEKAVAFEWGRDPVDYLASARRILVLGLRTNHHNLGLYFLRFDLELKHAEFIMGNLDKIKIEHEGLEDTSEIETECPVKEFLVEADTAYKYGVNFCLNMRTALHLYTGFFEVVLRYPRFEKEILVMTGLSQDLDLNCKYDPERYGAIAQIYFNQLRIQDGISELERGLIIIQDVKIYDIAIRVLNKFVREKGKEQPIQGACRKLKEVLARGLEKDALSEETYLIWLELLESSPIPSTPAGTNSTTVKQEKDVGMFNEATRIQVVNAATSKFPSNSRFATELLKNQIKEALPSCTTNQTIVKIEANASNVENN